jgi:hypothetical protein
MGSKLALVVHFLHGGVDQMSSPYGEDLHKIRAANTTNGSFSYDSFTDGRRGNSFNLRVYDLQEGEDVVKALSAQFHDAFFFKGSPTNCEMYEEENHCQHITVVFPEKGLG